MKKTLHISVVDKIATYCQRDGTIVCGNSDYVIEFSFDSEWNTHYTKTARFITEGTYTDVVFDGTRVAVPPLTNCSSVSVGVFSGNLKTTTPAVIGCQKSILCGGGVPFDPTPDVYSQIIDLINNGGGGGGQGGASWPVPEKVTAETRITEAGYYYAYAAFSGTDYVTHNFGVFYFKPQTSLPSAAAALVYAGHNARLQISGDGQLTLTLINRTINGTSVVESYYDPGIMYTIFLAKLS